MRIFEKGEMAEQAFEASDNLERTDSHGQIIIYTGMYRWSDGTVRDEPDPHLENDRPVL